MATRKPAPGKSSPASRQIQQDEKKRWQQAESACHTVADILFSWLRECGDSAPEAARQYASMTAIHYRKLRNGKVISPGDFDICVDVCRHALRTLQSLDATLAFDNMPRGEAFRQVRQSADWVLAELQKLKSGAKRT
jgi:hypothetical protein